MPSGEAITNNSIDPVRFRRTAQRLRQLAGGAHGVINNPTSREDVRRSVRGLGRAFTPDPNVPVTPTAIDPVKARRGVEALRRAT